MENVISAPKIEQDKKGLSLASILLSLSMLATGSCGLVAEYILSTVSSYILGNSIEQFSIIIALMMLMMGVANYTQKFMNDNALIEKFIIVEIVIAIISGFAPIIIFAAFSSMDDHFPLVLYSMASAIGFLIGFEIPLVLRINERYSESLPINLSRIISFDYFGSFIGAMVWIYLLRKFPLTEISFIVAGVNFFVATVTFFYFVKLGLVKKSWLIFIAILITSSSLIDGYCKSSEWEVSLEQRLYSEKICFSKTTKYQRMVMTHDATIDDYRFYLNGNLQFSSKDEHIYHELLVHPVITSHPDPKRVLILGGGDGMALREVMKHSEVQSVTLVDLDADMTNFCKTNPIMRKLNHDSFHDARLKVLKSGAVYSSGKRSVYAETDDSTMGTLPRDGHFVQKIEDVSIFNIDADRFIQDINDLWDVVIIDFPDPNSIELSKLYSKEFFLKLNKVLSPNGIFVIQSTSPYHAKESYLCIQRTIEAAGYHTVPFHENVPSFGDWGWFMGCRKNEISKEDFRKRLKSIEIKDETKFLSTDVFQRSMIFGKNDLSSDFQDISTLMRPVLLDRYLRYSWIIE